MKNTVTVMLGILFASGANALPINALPPPNAIDLMQTWMLPDSFTDEYDFEGIVALNNCSGSIVRFEDSGEGDAAMVLTNGHCLEGGFLPPGKHVAGKASSRSFTVLDKSGKALGRVKAVEIIYGTMTKTDMALYKLEKSYGEIGTEFKVPAFTLSKTAADPGTDIEVISGFWKKGYSCSVNGIVHQLKEAGWTWEQSLRYSQPGCETIGGTSGSPIVQRSTKTIVGVNNTGNENGQKCTMNNPCEVDENGTVTYKKGNSYGQQIAGIYGCLNADKELDLGQADCQLPK